MRRAPGIDVVTCLDDLADLPPLERLAFSVMGQTVPEPLRLHVMLQRFTFTEVRTARDATASLRPLREGVGIRLHNWDLSAPFDLRVPRLNWSLEVAEGRYVTYLAVGDQLQPGACGALLARLRATSAAVALGGGVTQPALAWGDVVLPVQDAAALLPPPMALIDRDRVAARDCVFRDAPPGAELSALVDRLAAAYLLDTACAGDVLLVRQRTLEGLGPRGDDEPGQGAPTASGSVLGLADRRGSC